MEQELWNFLFGWTGNQCMIPEGCTPPGGPLFYVFVAAAIAILVYAAFRKFRET